MKIKESTIREIRDTADVAELIGEDVKLTRLGSSLRGLCPFHREKTPSFFVHPGKHIYTCFSCGAKGGAIQYVMESKAMDFPDAVEHLAARYGIKVEYEGAVSKPSYESQMYRALELAAKVYQDALGSSDEAKKYLADRGISEETSKLYRLGFSGNGHLLLPEFAKKKISPEIAEKAAWRTEKQVGREIFRKSHVSYSRLSGKSMRIRRSHSSPAQGPKYVNSQDGLAYRKGSLLYGLKYAAEGSGTKNRSWSLKGISTFSASGKKCAKRRGHLRYGLDGSACPDPETALGGHHVVFRRRCPRIQSTIRSGKVLYAEGISPKALLPPMVWIRTTGQKPLSRMNSRKLRRRDPPCFRSSRRSPNLPSI
jgi:hypothetical protein